MYKKKRFHIMVKNSALNSSKCVTTRDITRYGSETQDTFGYHPYGECNKEYKYSYQSGAYFLYGFSDKAKHEIQHAIDHCQGITGWTRRETRAYALHQMKQGSAPRDAYISILRKNIMQSFNITNLPFDESEFQATLTELGI